MNDNQTNSRSPAWRKLFRLTNARILSQIFFFMLFVLATWASWTSRIKGYPVSRFLEIDPLIALSTLLSTGFVYRFLGWSLLVLILTLLFGRLFCNWICPCGTLHQFVGWLFNTLKPEQRLEKNRYQRWQFFKYTALTIFLLLSFLGTVQVGLLDPIVLMYRAVATVFAPASDMLINTLAGPVAGLSDSQTWLDNLKFAPGVANRVFFGSFWIGFLFLALLAVNLWHPRFFCRVLCPLGALLGIISRFSIFRINRNITTCTNCDLCLSRCEGAADPQDRVRISECFSCLNCLDDCPENAISFTLRKLDKNQVIPLPDFSRRKLLLAGLSGLLTFPLLRNNGQATSEAFSPEMIRPPGSVTETEFLKKCVKCGQCINVCPTNVLQAATLAEGGFEALWTPVLKFNIAHCQYKCILCSEVCPSGAIRKISTLEKLGRGKYRSQGPIRLGTAFINVSKCLPWANEIPCVVCVEVCPVSPKAIPTRDEEVKDVFAKIVILQKPFIVPDLCIGCGICQTACPVVDQPAVYVTAVGESRSKERRLLLRNRGSHEKQEN